MEASSTRRRAPSGGSAKAKAAADNSVTLDFELDKETKGAVRFAEVARKGEEAYVRTFYMRKELWDQLGQAESVAITITPVEE